jgi:hypothetical protein
MHPKTLVDAADWGAYDLYARQRTWRWPIA